MTISLIAHTAAATSVPNAAVTTGAINTTGADFLVEGMSRYEAATGTDTASDSKANSWASRTASGANNTRVRVFDSVPSTVGSGHTATFDLVSTSGSFYAAIGFAAFSGVKQ